VFILLVVLFFYSSTDQAPVAVTFPMESADQCNTLKSQAVAAAESRRDVRSAKAACLYVSPDGDKI
jgi:hypothetical protein